MSKNRKKAFGLTVEGLEGRNLLSAIYLVNASSGKVLDDPGFSNANGTQIIQYQLNGGSNQRWNLVPLANGHYEVVNVFSNKALDDPNFSNANGAR